MAGIYLGYPSVRLDTLRRIFHILEPQKIKVCVKVLVGINSLCFREMNFTQRSSLSISNLNISFNPDGWGPINGDKILAFDEVPYAHFDKKDKLGRPADFVQATQSNYARPYQRRREEATSTDFSYKHDAAEDSTFQLVDTSKTQSKSKFPAGMKNRGKGQNNRGNIGRAGANRLSQQQDGFISQVGGKSVKMAAVRGKAGKGNTGYKRQDRKADRVPSLAVRGDWDMIEEFDLAQLLKLAANIPPVEDLMWCGHVDQYDENYDKISTKTAKQLRKIENKIFYEVSTGDDPILAKLAVDGTGDVYATDAIISQLMAAPRSVYSWDIIVEKVDGMIFLDKRDDSNFDFLTVSETAHDPPSASEETDPINYPEALSVEATMINQNFSQQVLVEGAEDSRKTFEPNPFFDEFESGGGGVEPASVAYRYRKFTLGKIRLVTRCELHCWANKRDEEQFMTCHSLNEWDSRFSGGVNWRQKIDQQRGAVLATELKNNSCKLAKWTAQSILAGAHQMKLGYVSRAVNTNASDHVILATQFFKPKDLALQINLNVNNIWGIVKMICELLLSKPDGKYVLLKDPNKAIVRLYSVPANSFEEEEEGEEGEEGEGEENGEGEEDA